MNWLKAKGLLLLIVGVWLTLISLMLPFQLIVTILGFSSKPEFKEYALNFWITQDQMVNTILGGDPDETISSRVGRLADKGSSTAWALAWFIDGFFYVVFKERGHCASSIE